MVVDKLMEMVVDMMMEMVVDKLMEIVADMLIFNPANFIVNNFQYCVFFHLFFFIDPIFKISSPGQRSSLVLSVSTPGCLDKPRRFSYQSCRSSTNPSGRRRRRRRTKRRLCSETTRLAATMRMEAKD